MQRTYTLPAQEFEQALSILRTLRDELSGQEQSGYFHPISLQDLVQQSSPYHIEPGREWDYVGRLVDDLRKLYPTTTYTQAEQDEMDELEEIDD